MFLNFTVNIPTINTTSAVLYTAPVGKAFIVSNIAGIPGTTLQIVVDGNIIGDYGSSNYKGLIITAGSTIAGRTGSNAGFFSISGEEVDNI